MNTQPRPAPPGGAFHDAHTLTPNDATMLTLNVAQHPPAATDLDAWSAIAEILQPRDPDQVLAALDAAAAHDPYNEHLYVKIMRLQAAAGAVRQAVRRTLALLESRLAELGITPGAQTRHAAAMLTGAARAPGDACSGPADQ